MAKDLTTSAIDRQNILNNPMALPKIREALEVSFVEYKGTFYVTKQMAAKFYEVDERTVTNCLNANDEELRRNGYKLLQGEELKEFKQCFGQEKDFPTKTTILGVFDFRSFLNLGMLLTASERRGLPNAYNVILMQIYTKSGRLLTYSSFFLLLQPISYFHRTDPMLV